jgi:glycosyltransferase involved in cell wall biosynthesis
LLFTCSEVRRLAGECPKLYHPNSRIVVGLGVEEPPVYTSEMRNVFLEKCPDLFDSKFILYLSHVDEKKGVDLLINVYSKLSNDLVSLTRLVIANPSLSSACSQSLERLANQLECKAKASFS